MTSQEQIQNYCRRIADEFHPEKIILFGSHAYGTPGPLSDVDVLVVMQYEGTPLSQAAKIITRLNPSTALDVLVRTPEQIRERLEIGDRFMHDILERGKVVYETNNA